MLPLFELDALPALSSVIPPAPCVYIVLHDDEVYYVGQTSNLRSRLRDKKHPLHDTKGATLRFQPEADLQTRLRVETIYIMQHLPPRNKALFLRLSKGRVSEIRYRRKK